MSNRSIKVLKRHSAASFITCLFALVFIATPVLIVLPQFVPSLSFFNSFEMSIRAETLGSTNTVAMETSNNGIQIFLSIFKLLENFGINLTDTIGGILGGADSLDFIATFVENLNNIASIASSPLSSILTGFAFAVPYLFAAMGVFLTLAVIWAVILLFVTLALLIGGRLRHPGAPKALAKGIFVFMDIYFGIAYAIMFFSLAMFNAVSSAASVENIASFSMNPIISSGALIVAGILGRIIMSIIYHTCFKNRIRQEDVESEDYYNYIKGKSGFDAKLAKKKDQKGPVVLSAEDAAQLSQKKVIYAQVQYEPSCCLPKNVKSVGDHAFSKNTKLMSAEIPFGIKTLGIGAFANCPNLRTCTIPKSVTQISANCFFNCANLTSLIYQGTKAEWSAIVRGSNWLSKAGTSNVMCSDGEIVVNPYN